MFIIKESAPFRMESAHRYFRIGAPLILEWTHQSTGICKILADEAVEQNVIIKESESRGIKGKTLWNAKKALGVQSKKTGDHWSWMLPE